MKEALRKSSFSHHWRGITLLIIGLFFLTLVVESWFKQDDFRMFVDLELVSFMDGWTTEDGTPVDLQDLVSVPKDENGQFHLQKRMPDEIWQNSHLMFRCSNVIFEMHIDGEMVDLMEFHPKFPVGNSYGNDYHDCYIYSEDSGKLLTIDGSMIYPDAGSFAEMYLGETGAYFRQVFDTHVFAFLMSGLIIFIGIALLLFSGLLPKGKERRSMQGFACTAALVGLWSAIESTIPVFLFGHPQTFRALTYPILIALPYPTIVTINGWLEKPSQKLLNVVFLAVLGETVICTLGFLLFGLDCHNIVYVIHVVLLSSMVIFIVVFVRTTVRAHKGGIHIKNRRAWLGMSMLLFTMVIDICRYYTENDMAADAALYTRIGFIIFSLLLASEYFNATARQIRESAVNETYRRLAFTDSLTGIRNRTAFLADETKLKEEVAKWDAQAKNQNDKLNTTNSKDQNDKLHTTNPNVTNVTRDDLNEKGEGILVVSLDVNFLKKMNDTYGHAIGDRYIKTCASVITEAFAGVGDVYRVGGDEFSIFMCGTELEKKYESAVKALGFAIDAANKETNPEKGLPAPVSIAYGYAMVEGTDEKALDRAEVLADSRMYQMKAEMKAVRMDWVTL